MEILALPLELRRKVPKQIKETNEKSRDLAKVVVLLERCINFGSENNEKARNA